jgi:hypothetical protein
MFRRLRLGRGFDGGMLASFLRSRKLGWRNVVDTLCMRSLTTEHTEIPEWLHEPLSKWVFGGAIEVHRTLGPGLGALGVFGGEIPRP